MNTTSSDTESPRKRRRYRHACINCRKKKSRCPGEKPACSTCVRLKQSCHYAPPPAASRAEDRLAFLEQKLDLLLKSGVTVDQQQNVQDDRAADERSSSLSNHRANDSTDQRLESIQFQSWNPGTSSYGPSLPEVTSGMRLYFEHCHRQPIWLFEPDEVSDVASLPSYLIHGILALTERFQWEADYTKPHYKNARSGVMKCISECNVELVTLETLCLLSFSYFTDGKLQLGRFHLGLAHQLCKSAMLDRKTSYEHKSTNLERKKKLFWSLQVLEQSYGGQNGASSHQNEARCPEEYLASTDPATLSHFELAPPPPIPQDHLMCVNLTDDGIFSLPIHFGWVWHRTRAYILHCAHGKLKEPWKYDSMYSMLISEVLQVETWIPMCHRYQSVKFHEQSIQDVREMRSYWVIWMKSQILYHLLHVVINHPFLYIVAAQHNHALTIPNTFWRSSSEFALLHATWIVRMFDMCRDKRLPLYDPFFGYTAAVVATVHLYYCCATDARLKNKSTADLEKCRNMLKEIALFSPACMVLEQNLNKMLQVAFGTETGYPSDSHTSKIHLRIPLIWDILQHNMPTDSAGSSSDSLLHPTLTPAHPCTNQEDGSTFEIIVSTSPEVNVNTNDGGQDAPALSHKTPTSASIDTGADNDPQDIWVAPVDSFMVNTSWLWNDTSQSLHVGDTASHTPDLNAGEPEVSSWWNFGNL